MTGSIPTESNWQVAAAQAQAPVFPIRIEWNTRKGKWEKYPLTRNGHLNASYDVRGHNWRGANGYGIAMGSGWYALDLDEYKQGCAAAQWLTQWQVPTQTRTHRTVSGGLHLIYRTLGEWTNLQTRQNVVPGLDTRGAGGWIAFGEGYSVAVNAWPTVLPDAVCLELTKATAAQDVKLQPVAPVDADAVLRRLHVALTVGPVKLRRRWYGDPTGLLDTSRSGFDMSAAKLLGIAGFNYSEVYWLLATQYPHGVVARDGLNRITVRQIKREAARATEAKRLMTAKMLEVFHGR
ncbi:bifunctional DNA primase/polymerase [Ruegeria lacuscaerulensis]|uniref:bifunctional DNA primase/polymerase n=1 Tax=Ruegeria lacuscaerulensis TaxID=55218 RepID=UPI00147CAFAE